MGGRWQGGLAELTAGVAGLVQWEAGMLGGWAWPYAQLRMMNPHVKAALDGSPSISV